MNSQFNIYSNSGIDVLSVMAAAINRPNPVVNIGPIDLSCSFAIADNSQLDQPLTYVSPGFEQMTGYSAIECIGRNCRFLQSPQGYVEEGSKRELVDNEAIYQMKNAVKNCIEIQIGIVNFHKSGRPFLNLITIIPVRMKDPEVVSHFVAFQVDLISRSQRIMNPIGLTENTNFGIQQIPQLPIGNAQALCFDNNLITQPQNDPFYAKFFYSNETTPGHTQSTPTTNAGAHEKSILAKQIIECCPDLTAVISSRGILLYITKPLSKNVLGYEPSDLIGEPISKLFHTGDSISLLRTLKSAEVGEHVVKRCRIRTFDGSLKWVESSARKYQLSTRKQTKCYIMTLRMREEGQLDLSMLKQAVDAEATIIKVARHGMICEVFNTTLNPFIEFSKGNSILDSMDSSQRAEILKILATPINSNNDNTYHICATFHDDLTDKTCYLVIKRFTSDHSYIIVSRNQVESSCLGNATNIFSSISPHETIAIERELQKWKLENEKLKEFIQDRSNR